MNLDVPDTVREGWTLLNERWPWLDQPSAGAPYVLTGVEPRSGITIKVTAQQRSRTELFDWKLYTPRLSWDVPLVRAAAREAAAVARVEARTAASMDMDEEENDTMEADFTPEEETSFRYRELHTNERLAPQEGFPGRTLVEVLDEGVVARKSLCEEFARLHALLDDTSRDTLVKEVVLTGERRWTMGLVWANQRLLFSCRFPTNAEIDNTLRVYQVAPPPPPPDHVNTAEWDEEKWAQWQIHNARTPTWSVTVWPDLKLFECRTRELNDVWNFVLAHQRRYTEVDDEPSLLRRDRFDYDGDNMDEQVVSVAYARQLEAEQEAAALLQDAIGDVREHMDAYDMQMVDD